MMTSGPGQTDEAVFFPRGLVRVVSLKDRLSRVGLWPLDQADLFLRKLPQYT